MATYTIKAGIPKKRGKIRKKIVLQYGLLEDCSKVELPEPPSCTYVTSKIGLRKKRKQINKNAEYVHKLVSEELSCNGR